MSVPIESFRIERVLRGSEWFESVIVLHSIKKTTLGPFPRGAFEDHAQKGLILGAIDSNGKLAGYLLYRRSRSKASIVHLTRHDEYNGTGIIQLLVQHVLSATRDLLGVSLHCRQDYNLKHMWTAFGFTIRASKPGRGKDGALLDYWWYDHGHDDLFSRAAEADESTRISAVIDANVLYDLVYSDRPHHEDTSVLWADWIQDALELCVTRELYNEIARSDTPEEQEKARCAASGYRELKVTNAELETVVAKLEPIFGSPTNPRDVSDMMQLAHSIAGATPFFVTRDGPMLARKDQILELFPIEILHPTSLVNHLDTLQRGAEYRPALLEGTAWQRRLVLATDLTEILTAFKHPAEKNREFERLVRGYLAHPDIYEAFIVKDPSGRHAVFVVSMNKAECLQEVLILRHSNHAAAATIVRHIVHDLCSAVSSKSFLLTTITDQRLSNETHDSLEKLGFVFTESRWQKLSLAGIATFTETLALAARSPAPKALNEALNALPPTESSRLLIEQKLAPIKISSPEANAYVVSIRKGWAEQLFAMSFDGQALLNTDNRMLIGIEGVYYCSAINRHLTAPSRVLWYVSQGPDGGGPMSIVACSHIEEAVIDKPKKIFARFRNLGVYSWSQVFETAGRSIDEDLMAFRFVRTERFLTAVPRSFFERIGVPQPQNPRKISDEQFASIYRRGMNLIEA